MHVAIPTNIQILHSVGMAPPIITYFKMCNNFSCYYISTGLRGSFSYGEMNNQRTNGPVNAHLIPGPRITRPSSGPLFWPKIV